MTIVVEIFVISPVVIAVVNTVVTMETVIMGTGRVGAGVAEVTFLSSVKFVEGVGGGGVGGSGLKIIM